MFFEKLFSYHEKFLRPPGAVPEKEFIDRCIRCRKCQQICPYQCISPAGALHGDAMGTPVIQAREIPCYLCMKCPPVCPTGALKTDIQKADVRMGVARIDRATCLPFQGIICRACYENCPIYREAITLDQEIYPVVHPEKCVGCGICEHVCPIEPSAIVVESSASRNED